MLWTSVKSSNLKEVAYMDNTLYVRFLNGGEYTYAGVAAGVYQQLLAAASPGSYFHAEIKPKFTGVKSNK